MEQRKIQELFVTFMKIGALTFGGGYAMLPIIEEICVERKQWITHDDMVNITVIAESTPGPIAINCATFVGYRQAGFAGAVSATVGVVLPSFCVIFLISMFFNQFLENAIIANAFRGIKAGVGILICRAGLIMIKKMKKDPKGAIDLKAKANSREALPILLMIGSFAAMLLINVFSWNFSSVSLMVLAGAVSLALFLLQEHHDRKAGA